MSLSEKINSVREEYLAEFNLVNDDLTKNEFLKNKYLSRKGIIAELFNLISEVSDKEKPEIGKKLNVRVSFVDKYNEEESHFLTCNNPYFQMIQKAINKDISIEEEFNLNEHDRREVKWDTLKHISINLEAYKKNNQIIDFNDMIKRVVESDKIPNFKAVFIDEAQDLSPLQWKLYDKLKEKAEHIYLAGDDDQAIFAWAGADVNRFINEPAQEKTLRYSRRVSQAVQHQSNFPISKIMGLRKTRTFR